VFAITRDFCLHKFQLSEVITTAGRLDREAKRRLILTILISKDPRTQKAVIDLRYCKGCGLRAHICRKGAITMAPEQDEQRH
jgi:ferredoxin